MRTIAEMHLFSSCAIRLGATRRDDLQVADGMTNAAIAETLQVSHSIIAQWCKRFNPRQLAACMTCRPVIVHASVAMMRWYT